MRIFSALGSVYLVALVMLAGTVQAQSRCDDYTKQREVFFGDLHIHSAYSLDARAQNTRTLPLQAYAFARGQRLGLQPFDEQGRPTRSLRLDRPLDFAAITDHAEMLGELSICQDSTAAGYRSIPCLLFRNAPKVATIVMMHRASVGEERFSYCGDNDQNCLNRSRSVWNRIRDAARVSNDTSSACAFTAFAGYEWTGAGYEAGVNTHRNIIFRTDQVPDLLPSFYEHHTAHSLFQALSKSCVGDCDYISIPHNSNLSDGSMFPTLRKAPLSMAAVSSRAINEPIAELMQHKGSSECFYQANGADEECAFERLPYSTFKGNIDFYPKWAILLGLVDAVPPRFGSGYLRETLLEGLRYRNVLGINPYHLGFIGSTDTHLGAAGSVAETNFKGHGGAGKDNNNIAKPTLPDNPEYNPGGLAAVWAEENTRDALFAAMRRRETYSTSGPRIKLRVFAGYEYEDDLCNSADLATQGYASGTPMGGTLEPRNGQAPRLLIEALADTGNALGFGMDLQRIQVIKAWLDDANDSQFKVYEVAGDKNNGASVDLNTCQAHGAGARRLCTVWTDPDYAKDDGAAYYYVRAIENPSCRWMTHYCLSQDVDCNDDEQASDPLTASCCAAKYPPTIQERAVSSPIWHHRDDAK